MEPYIGIVVFELESVEPSEPSYFREDFVLVRATDDDEARAKVEALARSQESAEHPTIVMRHIVDIAPALDGTVEETWTSMRATLRRLRTMRASK